MFQVRKYSRMRVVSTGTWNKTGTWEYSKDDRVPDETQGGQGKIKLWKIIYRYETNVNVRFAEE